MRYDLIIVGAGWAGYSAAKKAVSRGLKVALIEQEEIGGTCLNRGCIPTKTLIQSAKVFTLIKKAKVFGIESAAPKADFAAIQARKDAVIAQLRKGMQLGLSGVAYLKGKAVLSAKNTLRLDGQELEGDNILIATGSCPQELKEIKFEKGRILSSDEILGAAKIPVSLLIIGGGVIGCEFASLFNSLGTQVTVAEKMPQLLPLEEKEIARKLEVSFKKKGIKVHTGIDATTLDFAAYELVLLCVGRVPCTQGLGLEEAGVKLEKGRLAVDACLRTNIPNIYAAGDCTGKLMLAHFAAYQGELAVHNILHPDKPLEAEANAVPNCIFTDPEVSSVGINEEKAAAEGLQVKVHRFDFLGSGMARIMEESDGFLKIVSAAQDDRILGASIIGPKATELIAVLATAVSLGLKTEDLKKTIFAHPTLAESIKEALG